MLTDRGKVLAASALVLWLVSRVVGVDEIAVAALACLALVIFALGYTRLASTHLVARRFVRPDRLFHDAVGEVQVDLRNEGRFSTATLVMTDDVPAALAEPARFVTDPVPSASTVRLGYRVRGSARGRYVIGPLEVKLRDPFGIAQRPARLRSTDEIIVYPPVIELPRSLPRLGRHGLTSEGRVRPIAETGEFANVREYVRGDALRKVHWKVTAHRGKLMVTQEEAPREEQATLVLDTRRSAHHGFGTASTFEQAVTAAASAARHLDERGYGLRLVSGPYLRPPTPRSWRLLLDELADIGTTDGRSLLPLWRQIAGGSAGDGMLLAIVAPPSPADLREMVRAGRHFAGRVALIVAPPDPVGGGPDLDVSLASLRGAGWRAAVHRPGERLETSWQGLGLRPGRAVAGVNR